MPTTITPRTIQLVLDTYEEHMSAMPADGDGPDGTIGHCAQCDTPIGPRTSQAHALEATAAALQSALTVHETAWAAFRALLENALAAWTTYGPNPTAHREAREQVHSIMPRLAGALDAANDTRKLIRLRETADLFLKIRTAEALEDRHDH